MAVKIDALYSDKLMDITRDALTFHNYYFWGLGKTVPVSDIQMIESFAPTALNGKWRIWGTSGPGGWMPMDWNRPSRDRIFNIKLKGKKFQIAFTVEDSSKARDILKQMRLMKE